MFGKHPFYTSKVGRRAVLLFILSALVPVTLLATLSGYQVWVQLEDVAGRHLHQLTKSAGLRVLTHLEYLDKELSSITEQLAALPPSDRQPQVQVIGARQQTGGVFEFHPAGSAAANRVRNDHNGRPGAALTSLWSSADRQYPIVLGRPIVFDDAETGVVLLRLPFEMLDLALDDGVEHCLLNLERVNIGCSAGFLSAAEDQLRELVTKGGHGTRSWLLDSEVRLMSVWSIFLGGHFISDNWLLVLDQPLDSSLYGSERFVRLLIPVVAFTLVLVMLVSSVAIRRNLVPLARLREATRRVAAQDLASRVQIDSKDEFKELGDCFNDMADSLSKQFTLIGTMAEIDRMILAARDVGYVVELLCQRIPELMSCGFVVVGLIHKEGDRLWIHYQSKSNGKLIRLARGWQDDERARIEGADGHTFVAPGASEFSFLPMLPDSHRVTRLVLPIVHEQRTAGFIAIGLEAGQRASDNEVKRLRDLADRAAVALSNAAWEDRLYRQAHYDSVTNLPNRNLLQDRIEQAVSNARRKVLQAGVLFLDLDHFKHVNDSLGHSVGDELLAQVARRIEASVRASDTVARLGGDEFIVVCPDLPSGPKGVAVVTRIGEKILAALGQAIHLNDREVFCSSSIGVAVYPEDGLEPEELLKRADAAMYEAKRKGRRGMSFYSQELEALSTARLEVESGLKQALSNDELVLYYQPKLDVRTQLIVGAEALLRWQHPERGLVPPHEFIPIAEETSLIVPIGQQVLERACQQAKDWHDSRLSLSVAVNLSAVQFHSTDVAATVKAALQKTGLPPGMLELEITESLMMTNFEKIVCDLQALKKLGVTLSLDDFGTGYSSLSYLNRFPIDHIKIDRSFVTGLPDDANSVGIARAIMDLAHHVNLVVVAEGVETEAQSAFLSEARCDQLQGYLFSAPVPAEKFEAFALDWNRRQRQALVAARAG